MGRTHQLRQVQDVWDGRADGGPAGQVPHDGGVGGHPAAADAADAADALSCSASCFNPDKPAGPSAERSGDTPEGRAPIRQGGTLSVTRPSPWQPASINNNSCQSQTTTVPDRCDVFNFKTLFCSLMVYGFMFICCCEMLMVGVVIKNGENNALQVK